MNRMYGLIGRFTTVPGQRNAFVAILLEGTETMPGCLSYVIATDPTDPDALWITEVWDSKASHQASLALSTVKAAIAKGRPLIAGFSNRVETVQSGVTGSIQRMRGERATQSCVEGYLSPSRFAHAYRSEGRQ